MLEIFSVTPSSALDIVRSAITDLQGSAVTLIPIALGLAVLVYGSTYLWKVAKKLMGQS